MTRPSALPPETFRLFPLPRRRAYFLVHIARTRPQMLRTMRGTVGFAHPRQLACVVGVSSSRHRGLLGVIFFPRSSLGAGLVAHELAHAAFRVADRCGRKVRHWRPVLRARLGATANRDEEMYCTILERLTRQFWVEAYRLRLAHATQIRRLARSR